MADLHRPPPGSAWPTLATIGWGLAGIVVAGWVAIGSLATDFGRDGAAPLLFLPPLAGPVLGALLSWSALALTPARHWARPVKAALTGQAALLGCLAMPFLFTL
ncbi:hypothetical protein ACIGZJ_06790 [Kitasatospora sp. NPDC052868]|uniref:hypothetical protein n=1 Tax=Kitasatospora sp. NPDC052868 TaxID=3364060 RepID=UPI0037CAB5EF